MLHAAPEQTTMLAWALVAVLDTPHARAHIRPRVDLEMILAPLTDVTNNDAHATPALAIRYEADARRKVRVSCPTLRNAVGRSGAAHHVHDDCRFSAQMVATLMRTWTGILYLCKNDLECVRLLVRAVAQATAAGWAAS